MPITMVVFNPGALPPVTTATIRALTCYLLPGLWPEYHPPSGWSLTLFLKKNRQNAGFVHTPVDINCLI